MKLGLSIVLGLLAAFFAAVLVTALSSGSNGVSGLSLGPTEREVAVATRDLPAGHALQESDIAFEMMSSSTLPSGAIGSRSSLLGRVLIAPVVAKQAITQAKLASAGSGPEIAAMLRGGYRASTITLADRGPSLFVYPGSRVDVLATFEVPEGHPNAGEIVSRTVLEGARVLAVEGFASGEGDAQNTQKARGSNRGPMLTLLLTPTQAQILQLATTLGSVSVTLRPPSELDQGASATVTLERLLDYRPQQIIEPSSTDSKDVAADSQENEPDQAYRSPHAWTTVIIRDGTRSTVTFQGGGS